MFNYIKGTISYITEGMLVVENNGIGYEIFVSNSTLCDNSTLGEEAKLFLYLQVKEDGLSLFGFADLQEKQLFLKLIEVSGVGCKVAMQILSSISVADFETAIASNDAHRLTAIKGIGKKTAERIILELKDKLDFLPQSRLSAMPKIANFAGGNVASDAVEALVNLGISKSEANRAVNNAIASGASALNQIIQIALKNLY